MTDIQLPALGESVTEGTITRWLKAVGDEVAVDEPIVEVSTDKVDTEVPSPVAGTITEILADEDDTVEVGAVIARVGDAGDAPVEQAPAEEAPAEQAPAEEAPAEEPAAETATEGTDPEADQEADEESAAEAQESPSQEAEQAEEAPQQAPAAEAKPSAGGGTDITLPALGESVTEGTITRWLKAVGDEVAVDEPIVEVSTDKVDTEVPSPVAGTITELLADEDDTVDVGAVIARVGGAAAAPADEPKADEPPADADGSAQAQDAAPAPQAEPAEPSTEQPEPAKAPEAEAPKAEAPKAEPKAEEPKAAPAQPAAPKAPAAPAPAAPAPAAPAAAAPAAPAQAAPAQAAPAPSSSGSPYVTPIVRKLANERGVDLASLTGSGVGGRIRKEDVLAAAEAKPTEAPAAAEAPAASAAEVEVSPLRGTTAPMSRLRKVVAKRAVESMQTLAQLTTVVEVDVTKVAKLRDAKKAAFQEETGQKLTFLPFFTQAAVEALKSHPLINATDDGEQITYPDTENLSMAVDTERGLLTPVIRDAGSKSIRELTAEIADLAQRTRDNKLSPDELAGGTFTLTNTGSRGALFDTPVVFQPQRAILGVGTVVKRPVVVQVDGQDSIAVRSMVFLALSYDHRIIDGADAARYLGQVKARLEEGAFEV
ncbi:2-oxoglutarate dehydrogenase, E2 component, dihydrolipoamide succinyltransferase [Agrococcus sp. BE272]|uniref:2-oxoglutarate dehydrogenase, E2 component, dihydrolipoamide succinyltransferase n=1 Tax=Agrococcus sp. BE272 TaxID=2817727 RepID=UPI002855D2AC|nr:2-oxoglutarate dehydrogenase, E2 component, dihydrolipoamide succinyltransferase [Agrococcus sp. BE272]MDR7234530.1 2-oxoglutarate dehydrogenase E2 component (dihydrolipoamide succinyltransferase) [Agrococcus sp. BE272]